MDRGLGPSLGHRWVQGKAMVGIQKAKAALSSVTQVCMIHIDSLHRGNRGLRRCVSLWILENWVKMKSSKLNFCYISSRHYNKEIIKLKFLEGL